MRSQWNGIKRFTLTIAFSSDTKIPALRKRAKFQLTRITSGLTKDRCSDRSGILTYPPEGKNTLWSRLFRAIATRATDLLTKILGELTYKFFSEK